jgi:deoxyribonuclease-4
MSLRIGAHMMTAGGLHRAVASGRQVGCDVVQIFTKSPQQWQSRPLADPDVETFRRAQEEEGVPVIAAHDSYLINPASADAALLERSRAALVDELVRSARLGIPYVVMHLGASGEAPEEEALSRLVESVRLVLDRASDAVPCESPTLLLETTAGQGTTLGYRFEHLGAVLDALPSDAPLGVCLDTCHIFAAGYELRDAVGYAATMVAFERHIGFQRLRLVHANDSRRELGSRVDRHHHIGQGEIGLDGFRNLLNDPRLAGVPIILETPKEGEMDPVNLAALRALVNGAGVACEG